MTSSPGKPIWIDLGVPDIEAAKRFYSAVFGWTYSDGGEEFGHYHQVFVGGALVGGMMQHPDATQNQPVFWNVYFETSDTQATLAQVTQHGGQVLVPAMGVGDQGTMASAGAPSGAQFGLWQPGTLAGFEPGTHGTAVWFDTPSLNFAADVAFYQSVLGWDIRYADDDPSSGFATVGPYESATIGLFHGTDMVGPDGRSTWRVFFAVDDMDAAVAAIEAGGGQVTDGPEDVSEGTQRQLCATAVDPDGAVFLLLQTVTR